MHHKRFALSDLSSFINSLKEHPVQRHCGGGEGGLPPDRGGQIWSSNTSIGFALPQLVLRYAEKDIFMSMQLFVWM